MDGKALSLLQSLHDEIVELKATVAMLAKAQGKQRVDPDYIPLDVAAGMAGKTKRAVQNLLARDAQDPDGLHPRRIHGGVHREDWRRFLEAKQIRGRGEVVRSLLEGRRV